MTRSDSRLRLKRIGPIRRYVLLPSSFSRLVESFSKSALLEKSFFKLPELLIQKVIGLMDEADDGVRGNFGLGTLDIRLIPNL